MKQGPQIVFPKLPELIPFLEYTDFKILTFRSAMFEKVVVQIGNTKLQTSCFEDPTILRNWHWEYHSLKTVSAKWTLAGSHIRKYRSKSESLSFWHCHWQSCCLLLLFHRSYYVLCTCLLPANTYVLRHMLKVLHSIFHFTLSSGDSLGTYELRILFQQDEYKGRKKTQTTQRHC